MVCAAVWADCKRVKEDYDGYVLRGRHRTSAGSPPPQTSICTDDGRRSPCRFKVGTERRVEVWFDKEAYGVPGVRGRVYASVNTCCIDSLSTAHLVSSNAAGKQPKWTLDGSP
ncbi:hypothetical protein GW17_00036491 [Ensete ventricosum]|nr:hypothetical protein GW17_00036491 [Ensete ventricosum]RZS00065.1 hypothetical protein BHM03_00029703 [Ensete ventricosum]